MDTIYHGRCRCGAVHYRVEGHPIKTGLCHCADCRKETGSAFLYYADWPAEAFSVEGDYATFEGRSFCPRCGSALFHLSDESAEICLGTLERAPVGLVPDQEGWIKRREEWLTAIPEAGQFKEDPF